MQAQVPAKAPSAPQSRLLALCFNCHQDFRNPAMLSQKKSEAILRVRTGRMPPGIRLTGTEKNQLIRQIQETAR
jgi:hypothetical protein